MHMAGVLVGFVRTVLRRGNAANEIAVAGAPPPLAVLSPEDHGAVVRDTEVGAHPPPVAEPVSAADDPPSFFPSRNGGTAAHSVPVATPDPLPTFSADEYVPASAPLAVGAPPPLLAAFPEKVRSGPSHSHSPSRSHDETSEEKLPPLPSFRPAGDAESSNGAAVPTAPQRPPAVAGWTTDHTGRHQLRYHDGTQWTEHVSDSGTMSIDPL
jgi:Protein of unknown function (DUF2510)